LGAQAVLIPEHRAAGLSPAVSKVSQGAAEHIPVVRDGALPQQLQELKDNGFWILGLAAQAKQNLYKFSIPSKVVWVLGSESRTAQVSGRCL
jgi:23S rRNA (guanosine2251-2'-O)-methyltransferase